MDGGPTSGKNLITQSSGFKIEAKTTTQNPNSFSYVRLKYMTKELLGYCNFTCCYNPLGKHSLTDLVRN
jgi:hypothetical protein